MLVKYLGPGCLAGITLPAWVSLLVRNRFQIAPQYLGKAAFLSVSSLITSACRPLESALYGRRLRSHTVEPPVFILGCWRSGTTYLHQLMCLDERFGSPSLFQTMYPHTFLMAEGWLQPLLDVMTPRQRFMDNVSQGLREPHEDEMALAIMTGRSNMLSWAFPRNADCYDRYLDFGDASPQERELWKASLESFVRKVAYRTGKRLVLKSPNHTARIRLIRELFPDARFLHIHRHPDDTYRSMCHMVSKVQPVWGLQSLPPEDIPELVIETYQRLYDSYLEQSAEVPAGHLHQIAYETLVADPLGTLAQCYETLGLGSFEPVRPRVEQFLASNASYQKNQHARLSDAERTRLRDAWGKYYQAWGYPTGEPEA